MVARAASPLADGRVACRCTVWAFRRAMLPWRGATTLQLRLAATMSAGHRHRSCRASETGSPQSIVFDADRIDRARGASAAGRKSDSLLTRGVWDHACLGLNLGKRDN